MLILSWYLDISSSMMFMPPEQVVTYLRAYGVHRILFGTDFPVWEPAAEVERLLALPLSTEEKQMIASQNALRLLGE